MKLMLVKVPRRLPWPMWSVVVVLGWAALVGSAILLAERAGRPSPQLCLFKRVTGYPCPTCGSGRGTMALLHGDVAAAWRFNPLLFSLLAVVAAVLAARVAFARAVRVELTRLEKRLLLAAFVAALLANWAYLIVYVG